MAKPKNTRNTIRRKVLYFDPRDNGGGVWVTDPSINSMVKNFQLGWADRVFGYVVNAFTASGCELGGIFSTKNLKRLLKIPVSNDTDTFYVCVYVFTSVPTVDHHILQPGVREPATQGPRDSSKGRVFRDQFRTICSQLIVHSHIVTTLHF